MRCQWLEKRDDEKRHRQCDNRADWELDEVKFCQEHIRSMIFNYPGGVERAKPLGKIILPFANA